MSYVTRSSWQCEHQQQREAVTTEYEARIKRMASMMSFEPPLQWEWAWRPASDQAQVGTLVLTVHWPSRLAFERTKNVCERVEAMWKAAASRHSVWGRRR